jgi:hypothetical protein
MPCHLARREPERNSNKGKITVKGHIFCNFVNGPVGI